MIGSEPEFWSDIFFEFSAPSSKFSVSSIESLSYPGIPGTGIVACVLICFQFTYQNNTNIFLQKKLINFIEWKIIKGLSPCHCKILAIKSNGCGFSYIILTDGINLRHKGSVTLLLLASKVETIEIKISLTNSKYKFHETFYD